MLNNSLPALANQNQPRYGLPVAANSATGIGLPYPLGGHRLKSGFFVSAVRQACNGRAVQGRSRARRFLVAGRPTLYGSAHPDWSQGGGISTRTLEATTMPKRYTLTLNPFKKRAAAQRAMARAALRADSSLSVRLKRYNQHMEQARALEALEVNHA